MIISGLKSNQDPFQFSKTEIVIYIRIMRLLSVGQFNQKASSRIWILYYGGAGSCAGQRPDYRQHSHQASVPF